MYKIWADMVAFDCNKAHRCAPFTAPFCTAAGTDGASKLDDYEVMMKYGSKMVVMGTHSPALSRGHGEDQMYAA